MEGRMNTFKAALVAAGIVALVGAGLREYPIFNGKLTSPLNANQQMITNLPSAFWEGHSGADTNAVNALIGAFAATGNVHSATTATDPSAVHEEADPKFTSWAGTNTYVKSESDPTVPAWAKEPNPPATGVTDVKVDGTSVVSGGVADVVVSNKQDRLIHTEADRVTVSSFWVDSAMQDWDLIVSAEVLSFNDSAAVVKMGYKWRSHSGISWSSVAVSYREVTANRIVSDPRYYEWYGEIRGYYPPESYDKACHIKLLRESGVSFVEREVDFVPSSASTNRLITSKGVADAIDAKVETDPVFETWKGTNTYVKSESDPTVPAWAKQENPPVMTESDPVALPVAQNATNRMEFLEGYIAGQRVRISVTNYYASSSGQLPRLRIEEWITATNVVNGVATETNYWQVVWDEQNKYDRFLTEATTAIAAMTNDLYQTYYALLQERLSTKAPRAWGTLTSAGEAAPAGSVWHTEPNTVFAGGTEYAHAMVGTGVIGVLTTKGAAVYTDGETGRFHFTTDDKQHFFGMNIASRYELGCATDGITVTKVGGNQMVDLLYNVTMTGKPILYYTPTLSGNITWEQITDSSGGAIPGATVYASWDQAPPAGSEICTINCGAALSGFFKAAVEYAATSKFETNMPADMQAGILATNVSLNIVQPIEPFVTNGVVQWRTKQ